MLKQNNKVEFLTIQSELSLEKAVSGSQLSVIRKEDKTTLHIALKNLVLSLVESLNIAQSIKDSQMVEIVFLIADKYWFLKLEELVLIFKRAKMGEYGKTYNRLDVQIVFEWIESYLKSEERAIYFERLNTGFKADPIPKELMENAYKKFELPKEEKKDDEQYQRERAEYFRLKRIAEAGGDSAQP